MQISTGAPYQRPFSGAWFRQPKNPGTVGNLTQANAHVLSQSLDFTSNENLFSSRDGIMSTVSKYLLEVDKEEQRAATLEKRITDFQ